MKKQDTLTKAGCSTVFSNDGVWRDAFNVNSIQNRFQKWVQVSVILVFIMKTVNSETGFESTLDTYSFRL